MTTDTKNDTITLKEPAPGPETSSATDSIWFSLMPMALVFAVLYFLVLRPQEKKQREHNEMVKAVKKGEKVLLASGIFGLVVKANADDDYVYIEISEDVTIPVLRSAISDVVSRRENAKFPEMMSVSHAKKKPTTKAKEVKVGE